MTEQQWRSMAGRAKALRRYGLYGGDAMSLPARNGKRKRYEAMVLANGPVSTRELNRRVDALIKAEMLGLTLAKARKRGLTA